MLLNWEGSQVSLASLPSTAGQQAFPSCDLVSEPSGDYQTPADARAHATTENKRIINALDPHAPLHPLRYRWAWQRYQLASAEDWSPLDINLAIDRSQWQEQKLSHDEQRIVQYSLGFFSSVDTLIDRHPVLALYRHITNPECRHFLLRQTFEEGRHAHACLHLAETLGLDSQQLHADYRTLDAVAQKTSWAQTFLQRLKDPEFKTGTQDTDRALLKDLAIYYLVFQGLFLHVGFVQIRSLGRRNKLPGTAETLRRMQHSIDQHVGFGVDVINQIKLENPYLWDRALQTQLEQALREAVQLETQYAYQTMPRGVLGLNAPMVEEYLQFIANERSAQIGLAQLFSGATNPFPWMRHTQLTAQQADPSSTHPTNSLNWD